MADSSCIPRSIEYLFRHAEEQYLISSQWFFHLARHSMVRPQLWQIFESRIFHDSVAGTFFHKLRSQEKVEIHHFGPGRHKIG